jgi:hypothetical protein
VIIRETSLTNVRVYWKSMAEMHIPISLLESTKQAEGRIFTAIGVAELRSLMQQ